VSAPALPIVIHGAAALSPTQRAAIRALDREAFAGHPFTGVYSWARDDHHVMASDAAGLAAHCAIVERVATQDGRALRLGGIGTVMTRPALRRLGLAARILDHAERFLFDALDADAGLLFCVAEIVPFYQRRGWRVMQAKVTVAQPAGTLVWPTPVMLLPRAGRYSSLDAPIDLCGLPF
jgi:aminoglycoside 2'-N-acetyltransferase I